MREVCSDPERVHYPQRSICFATMEREGAARTYARIHDERQYHDGTFDSWAEKASDRHPYHFTDGVVIFTALEDIEPEDDFLKASSPPQVTDDDEGVNDLGNTPGAGSPRLNR